MDRKRELHELVPSAKLLASHGDLTSEAYVKSLIDLAISTFGQIDIVVNNAGMTSVGANPINAPGAVSESGAAVDLSIDGWRRCLSRNLDTMFLMTKLAWTHLLSRPHGSARIINISSTSGPVNAVKGDAAYAAAKAGMVGFTKATALDGADAGITCNAIAPGK